MVALIREVSSPSLALRAIVLSKLDGFAVNKHSLWHRDAGHCHRTACVVGIGTRQTGCSCFPPAWNRNRTSIFHHFSRVGQTRFMAWSAAAYRDLRSPVQPILSSKARE